MNLNSFIVLMEIFPFFKGPAVRKMAQADFVVVSVLSHFEFAISVSKQSFAEVFDIAQAHDHIYCTIGVHPDSQEAEEFTVAEMVEDCACIIKSHTSRTAPAPPERRVT